METQNFLIEEYKTAVQLTNHIDELRSKLITFFLTFMGAIIVGVFAYLKGELSNTTFLNHKLILGGIVFVSWIIGICVVVVLARIRKVQIEHFEIANNIRKYFLKDDLKLWNVVQLSAKTLPSPNRKSGTYFWVLSIILLNSLLLAFSIYILFCNLNTLVNIIILPLVFIGSIGVSDRLYIFCATSPKFNPYETLEDLI